MAVQTPDPQFFAIEVKAVFFKTASLIPKVTSASSEAVLPARAGSLTDKDEGVRYPTKKDVESFPECKRGLSRGACGDILFAEETASHYLMLHLIPHPTLQHRSLTYNIV